MKWIASHNSEAAQGVGLLMLARNEADEPTGFVDLQVWPERASAEFGGGISPDLQSASLGSRGAALLFDWLFREIGIRLIAMTNALDNVRTEKLLLHLGFQRLTDRTCIAADGTERPSMYWELKRENWRSPFHEERPTRNS
ncbi:MAG: GNAT family protein [Pseudomonadota bacterium]